MRKPKLKPLSDEFWNVLEIGFMPWQTMPGMTALIRGNREKGIFLMVQSDYPAFGEGNGIKYSLCPSDKVPEIADAIVKISNSFDGNGFDRIEDRFVEVETIEDVFTLPDGETVAPGDFVEVVYKPSFSESLISRVMMVSCIETPGLMYDTEGDYYNSKDIISARKLFAELDKIDEETTENVKRKWRDGGMTCRSTDWPGSSAPASNPTRSRCSESFPTASTPASSSRCRPSGPAKTVTRKCTSSRNRMISPEFGRFSRSRFHPSRSFAGRMKRHPGKT